MPIEAGQKDISKRTLMIKHFRYVTTLLCRLFSMDKSGVGCGDVPICPRYDERNVRKED